MNGLSDSGFRFSCSGERVSFSFSLSLHFSKVSAEMYGSGFGSWVVPLLLLALGGTVQAVPALLLVAEKIAVGIAFSHGLGREMRSQELLRECPRIPERNTKGQ